MSRGRRKRTGVKRFNQEGRFAARPQPATAKPLSHEEHEGGSSGLS
jgi:hypothetical protein